MSGCRRSSIAGPRRGSSSVENRASTSAGPACPYDPKTQPQRGFPTIPHREPDHSLHDILGSQYGAQTIQRLVPENMAPLFVPITGVRRALQISITMENTDMTPVDELLSGQRLYRPVDIIRIAGPREQFHSPFKSCSLIAGLLASNEPEPGFFHRLEWFARGKGRGGFYGASFSRHQTILGSATAINPSICSLFILFLPANFISSRKICYIFLMTGWDFSRTIDSC